MDPLKNSIQYIKGVGPKKFKALEGMGIHRIEDLLYFFPREYEDRTKIRNLIDLQDEEKGSLKVTVGGKVEERLVRKGLKVIKVPVKDLSGKGQAIFYNAAFVKKVFKQGEEFYLCGKIKKSHGEIQIIHPDYESVHSQTTNMFHQIIPIYSLTKGLSNKDVCSIQKHVLVEFGKTFEEYLPNKTIERNRLCHIQYALSNIHFPQSVRELKVSKFRLVFEELLILQLGLSLIKKQFNRNTKQIRFKKTPQIQEFIKLLPFQLTKAQRKVLDEIEEDMESNIHMNRLVQGDVGSGKTIIAIIALYKGVLSGYQGVLMAPTEILAEQHIEAAKSLLEPLGIKVALLSGSVAKKKKEEILRDLVEGAIDIVIGTHALIEEKVQFRNLGLVITDEQHRFGVKQRSILSNKGLNPDTLVMTATPIPRTLALILYGDLDISIIDELPPGRKMIKTYARSGGRREKVYDFVRKEILIGRQAYIVAPLVEESENLDAKSVVDLYTELNENYLKGLRIGLLHGKMKSQEKDEVMKQFKNGEIQVLVATTVIEVGVNVPNATVMVIENSERFGLAQLHQLRGRVGRGSHQSYCILINCSRSDLSRERMKIMEKTTNGFVISEKDLELRGPGEFFGTRQHGIPELKIANLFKHIKILQQVQREIEILLEEDETLSLKENLLLKEKIIDRFPVLMDDICL